jgi:hypothetical protein
MADLHYSIYLSRTSAITKGLAGDKQQRRIDGVYYGSN